MPVQPNPDRRELLTSVLPAAMVTLAAHATSPPPPRVGDGLKAIAGPETLPTPAEATGRLGSPRIRVQGHVNRLQFSPKGNILVAASGSEIRAWDAQTGKVAFRVGYPENGSVDSGRLTSRDTFAMLVRPEGGGKQEIHHYAFGTGKLLSKSTPLEINQVEHSAFTVDGSALAVVRQEGLVLFDAMNAKVKWQESLPAQSTGGCEFFPNGETLALATRGEVRLFNVATGKLAATLKASPDGKSTPSPANGNRGKDWLQDLTVSPDGRWLAASVGEEVDEVICWDVKSSKIVCRCKPAAKPIAFTPDGAELLTYKEGVATFWKLADGQARRFEVPRDDDIVLSPNGRILAAGAGDSVILIDAASGQHLQYSADPPGLPESLTYRGPRIVGRLNEWGGWLAWDSTSGARTLIRPFDVAGKTPVAISQDGQRLLYRREAEYSLHDARTGKVVAKVTAELRTRDDVGVALTPNGETIVAWGPDGLVLQDANASMPRRVAREIGAAQLAGIAVCADGNLAIVGLNNDNGPGAVDVFDLKAAKFVRSLPTAGDVGQTALTADGAWLAVAHDINEMAERFERKSSATVFDVESGRAVLRLPVDDHRDHVIAFSADGRVLARLEGEKKIVLWEVLSGSIRGGFETGGAVRSMAFAPDGRTLAASVYGAPVFLWNLHAGPQSSAPGRAALDQDWKDLSGSDAAKAFSAIKRLAAHPSQAAPFLRACLAPVAAPDEGMIARLIEELDHRDFRKRESATRALTSLGDRAYGTLRKATNGPLPAETRQRIERLLTNEYRMAPDHLRMMRAIEAMEAAGTPEAKVLLDHWSGGAAGAMFTRSALAAARRVAARMGQ